ncbi:MAG: BtpA/SgcQ family protein [Acidimicrobiia bacterium]|nr:BtpA/SgcQ family protein [Acidimicrobiia bacterium]
MLPRLIGMIHLGPLPGSPGFEGDVDALIDAAIADGRILRRVGFDGLMIENFGDAPFYADDAPKVTIAAMTRAVADIAREFDVPIGVNVLRNDALGALAVAAATGARFIRVNVLSGMMSTDQGPIIGKAAEVARLRKEIAPDVAVMADVFVKHATPPPGLSLDLATRDLAERGGADAIIVSGTGTGRPPAMNDIRVVKDAADGTPIFVGSGVTTDTVIDILGVADGVIAGTAIKRHGIASNPVSPERALTFVKTASRK